MIEIDLTASQMETLLKDGGTVCSDEFVITNSSSDRNMWQEIVDLHEKFHKEHKSCIPNYLFIPESDRELFTKVAWPKAQNCRVLGMLVRFYDGNEIAIAHKLTL